jgi:putative Ca2+/H+ antiporter (TMEM165/GDT1 family)
MEFLVVAITAFVLILPVELPDKTFVATLVLSTRYPPLPVWVGVASAFGVQCLIAVTAGSLLTRLPERLIALVAAGLFAIGAIVLLRGARQADVTEQEQERGYADKIAIGKRGWRAAGASFLVLFTAEWADLSQLLTAGLVASGRPAVPVFVGSWLALALISAAAVLLGRWLLRRVRLSVVRYLGAAMCAILAVATVLTTFA